MSSEPLNIPTQEDQTIATEVLCPDAAPQTIPQLAAHFQDCLLDELRMRCAQLLGGSWQNPDDICVERWHNSALSNYIYIAYLPMSIPIDVTEQRKVLVRVYGEIVRKDVGSIIKDSVGFAILSEKGLGPRLLGLFKGGRIEQFIQSRPLLTEELSSVKVFTNIARHMARIHQLRMPYNKNPTRIAKILEGFLNKLTGRSSPPHHPSSDIVPESPMSSSSDNEMWDGPTFERIYNLTKCWQLGEEFEFLKSQFLFNSKINLPVVFCHNDMQENNILVLNDPQSDIFYNLLPIDFEYSSYNFRGFDVGNHFNEWCYSYTRTDHPYFNYNLDSYPNRAQQSYFASQLKQQFTCGKIVDRPNCQQINESALLATNDGDNGPLVEVGNNNAGVVLDDAYCNCLWRETTVGALYSHLFWTAWSLIQSRVSNIQFGFIEYAEVRMEAYFRLKQELMATLKTVS